MSDAPSTSDLDEVNRSARGHLLASEFNLGLCDHCDNAHFDLKDRQGRTFASALIGPEQFRGMAAWLCEAAEVLEKAGRLKSQVQG